MQRRNRVDVGEVEYIFQHEREIQDAVLEAKLGTGGHTGGAPSGHSYISDPTPAAALRNVEEINCVTLQDKTRIFNPEKWLKVIHEVREWCNIDDIDNMIFRLVFLRPKMPSRYEARIRRDKICAALNIEPSFYYARIKAICLYRDGVVAGML